MIRSFRTLVFVLSLSLTSSCYDAGGGAGTGSLESFELSFGMQYCELFRTCPSSQLNFLLVQNLSASQCVDAILRSGDLGVLSQDIRAYVADGSIRYSPEDAAQCLDALRSQCIVTTSVDVFALEACRSVFAGTLEVGASCFSDEQCAGTAYCDGVDALRCGAGACTPALTAGQRCARRGECGGSADVTVRCDYDTTLDHSVCVSTIFELDLVEGARCGDFTSGGVRGEYHCAPGTYCRRSSGGPSPQEGICTPYLANGATCSQSNDICALGHACMGGSCRPVSVSQREGDACDDTHLCNVFVGFDCIGGFCTKTSSDGALSSSCRGSDFSSFDCNPGLYCDEDTLTCVPLKMDGSTCTSREQCASNDCDYGYGVCLTRTYCR